MTSRSFHLGDILSVATGCLVSPRHIDGVYDLCNFMTGDNLFTHQLPRAANECGPEIFRQHPDLKNITVPSFDGEAEVWAWLAAVTAEYGEHRDIAPLAEGDHTRINPLDELALMRPGVDVIAVVLPEGGPQ